MIFLFHNFPFSTVPFFFQLGLHRRRLLLLQLLQRRQPVAAPAGRYLQEQSPRGEKIRRKTGSEQQIEFASRGEE